MPAVRSVSMNATQIRVVDKNGTKTLLFSAIPSAQNTAAKWETWINGTWIPANITEYQARVHVFAISPPNVTVWTGDLGVAVPANWWL